MSIRDFVRNTRRNRRNKPAPVASDAPLDLSDPLSSEPETAEQLAAYLSEGSTRPVSSKGNRQITLHTVKQTDTLNSIAIEYFGDSKYAVDIADANLIDLTNDQINVGDILTIPI